MAAGRVGLCTNINPGPQGVLGTSAWEAGGRLKGGSGVAEPPQGRRRIHFFSKQIVLLRLGKDRPRKYVFISVLNRRSDMFLFYRGVM